MARHAAGAARRRDPGPRPDRGDDQLAGRGIHRRATRISIGGFFWFPEILSYDGGALGSITLPSDVNFTATANALLHRSWETIRFNSSFRPSDF